MVERRHLPDAASDPKARMWCCGAHAGWRGFSRVNTWIVGKGDGAEPTPEEVTGLGRPLRSLFLKRPAPEGYGWRPPADRRDIRGALRPPPSPRIEAAITAFPISYTEYGGYRIVARPHRQHPSWRRAARRART